MRREETKKGGRLAAAMTKALFEKYGFNGPITEGLMDRGKALRKKIEVEKDELDRKKLYKLLSLAREKNNEGMYETVLNFCEDYLNDKDRNPMNDVYDSLMAMLETW